MKTALTFYVLKHLYSGLLWNEARESWESPSSIVDVYRLKYWTSEADALEYFDEALSYIPTTDHKDVILSTIVVETNLIF